MRGRKQRMESRTKLPLLHILILFISHSPLFFYQANAITSSNTRETLEIGIGIGGASPPSYSPPEYGDCPGCTQGPDPEPPVCPEPIPPPPPPPEPECPPPPSPKPHKPPPPPPPPPDFSRELQVIQRFKRTITEDPFGKTKTWRGNNICRDYEGFVCDTTISTNQLKIAIVDFNGFRFNGRPLSLTNFLGGLTDLIAFHVNTNNFTGGVPSSISNVPILFELDLSNNKLVGEFPKTILAATNLTFLDLRYNMLTGKIPPEVFTLTLDVLYLQNNQFVGYIPETIGKLPALYLSLSNNKLTGPIPRSIGQGQAAKTLLEVSLDGNQLSGCLPYEIGLLKRTYYFDASSNYLTGPIPHSFGCLKNMEYLNISYNQFYGAVPEPLCKLGLFELTLKSNYFTQVGPECRKLIKKGVLDVSMNCILDLPNQRSAADCAKFFLKEHTCPDMKSLTIVPCKIAYSSGLSPEVRTHKRSHDAIHKHH